MQAEGECPALHSVCFSSATAAWRSKVGASAFAANLLDEEQVMQAWREPCTILLMRLSSWCEGERACVGLCVHELSGTDCLALWIISGNNENTLFPHS